MFAAVILSYRRVSNLFKIIYLRKSILTHGCVGDKIHLQDEVIFEENVANDGEQIDQNESEHGGQHDGASVTSHALDYIQQGLLSVHQVKELRKGSTHYRGTASTLSGILI